jgi:hypothetical protein
VVGWPDDGLAAADGDFIYLLVAGCCISSVCPCPQHNTANSREGRGENVTFNDKDTVLKVAGHESTRYCRLALGTELIFVSDREVMIRLCIEFFAFIFILLCRRDTCTYYKLNFNIGAFSGFGEALEDSRCDFTRS